MMTLKDGNFQCTAYTGDSALMRSLEDMRLQMTKFYEEERQRAWTNAGLAKFADLLRNHGNDAAAMFSRLINELVVYLQANQGQIYILHEGVASHLELMGCYAYNRKKHINKQINPGEGLVGQCFLEKDIIVITNVPADYITITSGLGEALPRCIILIPLIMENQAVGVIEIASFKKFDDYQIAFVRKVAETIAGAIIAFRMHDKNNILLHDMQHHAEQLRAQEEELRQNIEELSTSQEQMKRLLDDSVLKEGQLRQMTQEIEAQTRIINEIAIVSKTNVKGEITYVNDEFVKWSGYTREELIGKNHRILKSGHQPDEIFVSLWKTIRAGKIWRGEVKNKTKDGGYYWVDAIIAPVLGEDGKPKEYIAQRFVINDKKEREALMESIVSDHESKEQELVEQIANLKLTIHQLSAQLKHQTEESIR